MTARILLMVLVPLNAALAAINFALGDPFIGAFCTFAAVFGLVTLLEAR